MNAETGAADRDGTTGRVWLITGASSGFGRSIAAAALAAGDTVVATARRPEALDDLVAAYPDRAVAAQLDVTDTARIAAVVADTVLWHGRIDVVVNNAGLGMVGAVEETSDQELRDLMDLHFFGPAALVRAVLPHMRRRAVRRHRADEQHGRPLHIPRSRCLFGHQIRPGRPVRGTRGRGGPARDQGTHRRTRIVPDRVRRGGALRQTAAMPAYEATVGPVRTDLPGSDGKQEGDPDKAAAAILTALAAERTPLRLPLGNDATDAIQAHLEAARAETLLWEKISRSTAFDD